MTQSLLSIVAPAYNEERVLGLFHERLTAVLDQLDMAVEIIYINDGSKDTTAQVIEQLRSKDPRVAFVNLSRNFGKEIAMTAGLDHAKGDAVIVIDTDLQDPPELIADLIVKWREGYDVVYARRTRRDGETWLKKTTASLFYRLMRHVGPVRIPEDTGDFRLLSRRAVDALLTLREQHRFMKGLFAWVGFPQTAVQYRRDPRAAGTTSFNYWKLWNFALEGITSFTTGPLKIATYLGLSTAVMAFGFGAYIFLRTLLFGDPVRGYPSLMVTVLFLGGIQLFFIGIIGEYLGRVYTETKNRPLYIVQDYHPAATTKQALINESKP